MQVGDPCFRGRPLKKPMQLKYNEAFQQEQKHPST